MMILITLESIDKCLKWKMYPESQNCIDLGDCSFEQDEITHAVNMIVPTEANIMAQANYVKDADGVTYCELPDVAIVNNVRFEEDNKLYMEWEGCEDGQNVYFARILYKIIMYF